MSTELTRETIQRAVGEWAEQAFPEATPTSIVTHLMREVDELMDAIKHPHSYASRHENEMAVQEELADCYLLLLHLAYRFGIDLVDAGAAKHIVNQDRTSGPPDADGVSEHERSEGA